MHRTLAWTFLAAACLCAGAQEEEELPGVVVEGEATAPDPRVADDKTAERELRREPGAVGLVDEKKMDESRGATLHDVLDALPGLMIRPRLGGASDEPQISIRGSGLRSNFHARGINLLVDGFQYGNADGFADFDSFEMKIVKRIEVYKGVSALRYGGNTLGGAINLVTKTGRDFRDRHVELGMDAGSFGYWKTYGIAGSVTGGVDALVYGSKTESHGYRRHSQLSRERSGASLGVELGGGASLRFDISYTRALQKLPGSLTEEQFEDQPYQAADSSVLFDEARNFDYGRGATTLRIPAGRKLLIEWVTQFGFQELDHPLSFSVIDDDTYNWGTEARLTLSEPIGGRANRFIAGVQYYGTRMNENFYRSNPGGHHGPDKTANRMNESYNLAVHAEDQFDVIPELTLVLGARGAYSSRKTDDRMFDDGPFDADLDDSDAVRYHPFTPRLGFVARAGKTAEIYGNVSRGYESPLLFELAAPGQIGADFEELKAQRAWQFELGTRGSLLNDRLEWDLAVYDLEIKNEIRNVNVEPFPFAGFTLPRYENIRRSRHFGVELGASAIVLKEGDHSVKVEGSYTYSKFRFRNDPAFGDRLLPGAPVHFATAQIRYDHASGFWIAPGLESTPSGYFADSAHTQTTNHYTLWKIRAGFDVKKWNLSAWVEVRNIGNTRYMSAIIVDSATGQFVEPGDPRSIFGGVTWRF